MFRGKKYFALALGTLVLAVGCAGSAADSADDVGEQPAIAQQKYTTVESLWVNPLPSGTSSVISDSGIGVCRYWTTGDNAWQPGKIWNGSQCRIEWGGRAWWFVYPGNGYAEALENDGHFSWQTIGSNDAAPDNAVQGGVEPDGAQLLVCEGWVNEPQDPNSWHPGKFLKGVCLFEWAGNARTAQVSRGGAVKVLVRH